MWTRSKFHLLNLNVTVTGKVKTFVMCNRGDAYHILRQSTEVFNALSFFFGFLVSNKRERKKLVQVK